MGKPLLTDEIIAKARSRKRQGYDDLEDTRVMPTLNSRSYEDNYSQSRYDYYENTYDDEDYEYAEDYEDDDLRIYKSRRIENTKRSQFQRKLNLILFVVIVLIALLVYAVLKL